MKFYFSVITAFLLSSAVHGQWSNVTAIQSIEAKASYSSSIPQYDYKSSAAVIWSEDFSSGFPAGWNVDDISGICPWVLSTNGSFGFSSIGATQNAGPAISSTTAANGFLINDPDSANHFTYGQPADSTYQYLESYFVTSAIDLSNDSNVRLEFEHTFRYADSTTLQILVSSDSVNWSAWNVKGNTIANVVSYDPITTSIDISAIAGGESTVYLKFGWRTLSYYWMIDDLRIVEIPTYDKAIYRTVISHTGDDYQYARIRESQLLQFFHLGMSAQNAGFMDQSNITLSMDVSNVSGSFTINESATYPSLASGDSLSLLLSESTAGLNNDNYEAFFSLQSDQDSSEVIQTNDTVRRVFKVGPYSFDYQSLDGIGIHQNPIIRSIGTNTFANSADGLIVLAKLKVTQDLVVGSVQAAIGPNSTAGGEVLFGLHYATDVLNGDVFSLIAESSTVNVQQWHIDNGEIWADFTFPVNATPGDYYLSATMNSLGNASTIELLDDLTIPQPLDAGLIYIATGLNAGVLNYGNAPALRVNSFYDHIPEHSLPSFTLSPNPTTGAFRITSSENETFWFEVRNALGQLVLRDSFFKSAELDLSGNTQGIYAVRLFRGNLSKTQMIALW